MAIRSTDLRTRRARHSDHGAATRLLVGGPALALVAGLLVAVFSSPGASAGSAPDGRSVYLRDCASCHAANGTGSSNGPTLQGVGAAAVDYQVSTGRMPLPSPHASSRRRTPAYDPATIAALVTFVGTIAPGGPGIPTVDAARANIANGGQLFRAQCAACHQWAGEGGALRFGNAPSLAPATPTQIAEAVRTGPSAMPVFGQAALDDAQLRDLVGYVRDLDHPNDAGGEPLWHLGPLAEGGAALLALAGLVVALRWMGTRT